MSEGTVMSSTNGSESMLLTEDRTQITNVAAELLVSISEITAKLAYLDVENNYFIEVGTYFYRVSIVVMELQTAETYSTNATNILLSLQKNINFAKEQVSKFQKSRKQRSNLEELEKVIKLMGEDLSFILVPNSEDQEYVYIAVRALSTEMRSFHFDLAHTEPEPLESDLYSINVENTKDLYKFEKVKSKNSRRQQSRERDGLSEYMEPLYDTFICSLTNKIMEDPVTIESGVTFEKTAIAEWYKRFKNLNDIVCPKTGQRILSRVLNTNMALKATIEEWEERNEVARIKAAMSALSQSQANTDTIIFEALEDLGNVCFQKHSNREQVLSMGILPLLAMLLEYKDRKVRCASLELLLQLVEDDEVKEMVGATANMTILVKMLSSNHPPIRRTTLLLLIELSKSKYICQRIGSTNGAILMLITIKYKRSYDSFASEKAEEILRNLECFTNNIKFMADNGYLEPLLGHLIEGIEEIQMEMASYLGENVLGHDSKILVAERASPALIKMVDSRNSLTRTMAFQALKQISSYHPNIELLIQDGIIKITVEEILTLNEMVNSKNEAAIILANIFESGVQVESLEEPTVYEMILSLNKSASDELSINLIRVFLCLTKTPQQCAIVVLVIKKTEASLNYLIELIDNQNEELQISAIKLLISLSPFMGHTLADRLSRKTVQLQSLIEMPNDKGRISERHAASANFLAKLPHQNLTLNLALVNANIVPNVLQAISMVQRSDTRTNRYAIAYLENLVGILVRFTKTLYDNHILLLARKYNFAYVFTELLTTTSNDEVQRLSAIGLENLSIQSITLSKSPTVKNPQNVKLFFLPTCGSFSSSKYNKKPLCPVHRGVCSSQDTFCLVEGTTIERLLSCLDHDNAGVVQAALLAICTLLDDNVDVEKSVSILSEANIAKYVLNLVREHKEESLWEKSFWVIERLMMKGGKKSISDISQDRLLPAILVNAFDRGDRNTREIAESILMKLNMMSSLTTNFTT